MLAAGLGGGLDILGARFEVESLIGRGAFGTVYAAWDREAGERVAVKRLDRLDAASRVRFKRELRALARVRHDGLVRLYELHPMGATYGLSMELVEEGLPFVEAFRASNQRASLLAQLAEALFALHQEGWSHNDLKPANALVTAAGRVVLLDFGLLAPVETGGVRAGTLAYMAPERGAGAAGDWYSIGVMLFEAFSGRLPHEGSGRHLLMRKRQNDAPPLATLADVEDVWATLTDGLLQRDPEARITGLRSRLEAAMDAQLTPPRATSSFVGRTDELNTIRRALEAAPEQSVVIEARGPSGIGKSALLARAARQISSTPVLHIRCNQQDTLTAAGLDALVDELIAQLETTPTELLASDPEALRAVAEMFPQVGEAPEGRTVDPANARSEAARGLGSLLRVLAPRPVLVIDDAQWLDGDSTELLRALLTRTPLAILMTMRADLEPTARPLKPDVCVELGPLDDAEIRELVGDGVYADLDRTAWESAAGRPYLALELAHMARAGERPDSTDAALRHRLDGLGENDRALLAVLALAERPIERRLAAYALDSHRGGGSFLNTVSSLRARRLIEVHGMRSWHDIQLQHEFIRRAVRDRLDATVERALHGALDDAFEALEIHDPSAQGTHALGAGRLARGRGLLCTAADEAEARFAFLNAARLFAKAREAGPCPSKREGELYRREGEAWGKAGRGIDAARALDGAIPHLQREGDTSGALYLQCRRAELLMRCGATEDAVRGQRGLLSSLGLRWWNTPALAFASLLGHRALERALAYTGRVPAPNLNPLATDVYFASGLALTNIDPIRGTDFVMRSLVRARAAGDATRTARAAAFVACYAQNGGHRAQARGARMIEEAATLAERADDTYAKATVIAARCLQGFHNGQYREAVTKARAAAQAYAGVPGAVRERATAELYEVLLHGLLGDYDDAASLTERLVREAVERGDRFAEASLRTSLPNLVWLVQDQPARALEECREAMRGWDRSEYHLQHLFDAIARARVALYEDRALDAHGLLQTVWARARRALHLRSPFIRVTLLDLRGRAVARAVSAGSLPTRALDRARADGEAIAREGSDWSRGFARSVEASVAHAEGRDPSELLYRAERAFAHVHLLGHAAAAGCSRDAGDQRLRKMGVQSPARFSLVLSCGWVGSSKRR